MMAFKSALDIRKLKINDIETSSFLFFYIYLSESKSLISSYAAPRGRQASIAIQTAAPYCSLFERFNCFNQVQSALFNDILHSNKSVVLSAPTGSGKTVAFELAIVRMLLEEKRYSRGTVAEDVKDIEAKSKAVYVAPIKALCTEKFNEWEERFRALGVNCVKITGDSDLAELLAVRAAQLIITTPEKWDILTRSAMTREYPEFLNDVRLFMVDEVHLLNEDVRGPTLEAIMSRMKRLRASLDGIKDTLRFIVASATIPNTEDFALWISNNDGTEKARKGKEIIDEAIQLVYMDSQRPVPLRRLVIGVQSKQTGFKFDISLNYKLVDIILKYSDGKATMIFCNSRKSTEMAAAVINADRRVLPKDKNKRELLSNLSQSFGDAKLCKYVKNSIAFHHAGVSYQDRSLIEESFRNGSITVLLCTNTLAMGVNLPAHLVIIKSTQFYAYGALKEYAESTLLQMIGRAGRSQCDVNCTSVVLTQSKNVQKYSNLINGKIPIESHLHKHLTEHLNAEIAFQSIKNIKMAMEWIRSTYLYIRLIKNPTEYGLPKDSNKETVEKYLEKQCLMEVDKLESIGLISKSFTGEINLHATEYGKIMANFSISYDTLKIFQKAYRVDSLLNIVNLIMRCHELSQFTLRTNEKKQLNELNKKIRFPLRKRITTREEKISCIIQAVLGNLEISLPCLSQESSKIIRISKRLANCLVECILVRISENQPNSFNLGCYKALLYAVTISKCFHAKLWENSEYVSKQLRKIGAVYSSALVNAGKTTLKSISETSAEWFEMFLNESHPFGTEILENVNSFPAYLIHSNLKSIDQIQIYVKQTNSAYISTGSRAALIVGDSDNTLLLYIPNIDTNLMEYGFLDRTVLIPNENVEKIFVHIVHNTIVGVDTHQSVVVNESLNETKISNNTALITQQLKSNMRKRKRNQIKKSRASVNHQKIDLQNFMFSKPKISELQTKDVLCKDTFDISDDRISSELSSLHITEKETNFETNTFNKKTFKNTSSSDLIQTKLTKFFNLKKFNVLKPQLSPKDVSQTKSINNNVKLFQNNGEKSNKENIENIKLLGASKRMDNAKIQCINKRLCEEVESKTCSIKTVATNSKSAMNNNENLGISNVLNFAAKRDNTFPDENYNTEKSKHFPSSPLDLSVKRGNVVSHKNKNSIFSKNLSGIAAYTGNNNTIHQPNLKSSNILCSRNSLDGPFDKRKSTVIEINVHKKADNVQAQSEERNLNQNESTKVQNAIKNVGHLNETKKSTDVHDNTTLQQNKFRLQISQNITQRKREPKKSFYASKVQKINNNVMNSVLKKKLKQCTSSYCYQENNLENNPRTDENLMLFKDEVSSLVKNKALDEKYEELKVFYKRLLK